jgi:hypothetical protein
VNVALSPDPDPESIDKSHDESVPVSMAREVPPSPPKMSRFQLLPARARRESVCQA